RNWSLQILRWIPTVFTAIVLALVGTAINHALWQYFYTTNERKMAKAALLLVQQLPNNGLIHEFLYPWPEKLLPMAQKVNALVVIKPPLINTDDVRTIADRVPEGVTYGNIDEVAQDFGQILVRGWAICPERGLPADSVVLTCDDVYGRPTII